MSIRILNGGTPTPFPGALNAPSNVVASNPTSSSIDLAWTAPAQGSAIEYRVRDNSDDSLVKTVAWPSTGTTISGLTPETAYVFYVVTSDGTAKESTKSNTATETTLVAGATPTGIFVDKEVVAGSTYNPITRLSTGGTDTSYTTVQAAVNNVIQSQAIYIRGAPGGGTETYLENVLLGGQNAPDGTPTVYCSMQSYPGEWAIIDGQHNNEYTIGYTRAGDIPTQHIAYWKFERLGITGGCNDSAPSGGGGAGLYISGGPFIVRFCDIYENYALSNTDGNNPGGIVGYHWQECLIEFNHFRNNGASSGNGAAANSADIIIFSDYDAANTAEFGYTERLKGTKKNEIRYNHFNSTAIGFKNKASQFLTGRNPPTAPYDDTYKDYGDKIHHNFFTGFGRYGVMTAQDFSQVYNNIFTNSVEGVSCKEDPGHAMSYKQCVYNNTYWNLSGGNLVRYGSLYSPGPSQVYWGYDYNNLFDSHQKSFPLFFNAVAINLIPASNLSSPDVSNYACSNNYIYRPDDPDAYRYINTFYTVAEFEAQTDTSAPRVMYTNAYDAGNLVYAGTTGADKYTTDGTHLIEGSTTIADGGTGGAHPYLAGVTIPSYVGATNPVDNAWVDGVINDITSVAWLKSQAAGSTPTWVEA